MKCPVCKYEYDGNISTCPQCSFPELGRTFVSTADADEWMNTTVNSCRKVWNKALSIQVSSNATLDDELETYIPYEEYCSRLQRNPHDYKARSWLVDYLTQIIVYRNNYPVENRTALINEAVKHINFFLANAEVGSDYRLRYTATAYRTCLAEVYLSEWDLASALGCYFNYLSSSVFSQSIADIGDEDAIIMYESEMYYVLHNCAAICGIVGSYSLRDKLDNLCKRVAEIEYQFEDDKNYCTLYFRGIKRRILSPENGEDLNNHLSSDGNVLKECTYDTCCHNNTLFSAELDSVPWVGHDVELKDFHEYYQLFSVTPLKEKDFIWEQRNTVERYAKQILAMFKH